MIDLIGISSRQIDMVKYKLYQDSKLSNFRIRIRTRTTFDKFEFTNILKLPNSEERLYLRPVRTLVFLDSFQKFWCMTKVISLRCKESTAQFPMYSIPKSSYWNSDSQSWEHLSLCWLRTKRFEGVVKGNTEYQLSELFVQHGIGIEEK